MYGKIGRAVLYAQLPDCREGQRRNACRLPGCRRHPRSQKIEVGRDPFVPVVNGEIAFPDEKVSNTARRLGVVSRAKLGQEDSDCLHALYLEGSGDHAWLVVEIGCSGLTRSRLAFGMEGGRIVQGVGDGGRA